MPVKGKGGSQLIGIYVRVSTEDQAVRGYSIPGQIRECKALAGQKPAIIFADEGLSGDSLDRPALAKLRQAVREGKIKEVICLDPDRLSRKLLNQLLLTDEFDRHGVRLRFVNGDYSKTPEGTLFYALRGAISEFEKAKITERMCRGRREKAKQGKVLRDFQIYGYDYDKERETLRINQAEAEVVQEIFQRFLNPPPGAAGLSGIARWLNERGIPTKRGAKKWHRQVIRQILTNPTYVGRFYHNKWAATPQGVRLRPKEEWILVPCPPIIDESTFEQVQACFGKALQNASVKLKF
ncbi:MAG: recombinase family protein [Limnochordia bacterium]